ncbi:hypothetical protein [Maribacter sp. 4G9]|uniref:hypothetical protein n=1 Tax=Maribacter sp. 4G9 TaxID=1889777 RepID=UPI0013FD2E5D|nr:hypothetical protein [Maribacter sp. 4G9]
MKKIVSIAAVAIMALGLSNSLIDNANNVIGNLDDATTLSACDNCHSQDDRRDPPKN